MSSLFRFRATPRFPATLIVLGLACGPHAALAGTANYGTVIIHPYLTPVDQYSVTTTTDSPKFNRPGLQNVPGLTVPPTALSGGGKAVGYATHDFSAASNGTYSQAGVGVYQIINTITSGYASAATSPNGTSNFVQVLYSPTFDPTMPLTNALLADSQGPTTDSYAVALSDGAYTAVNTGYYNSVFTGSKLSIGSSTTTISQVNFGSTHFVPDYDPTISTLPGVSQTLTLNGGGPITSFNSFTFDALQSDSVGFLAASLTHNGVTVNLFTNPAAKTFGATASLDPSATYTFADKGLDLAKAAINTVTKSPPTSLVNFLPGATYKSQGALSAFKGQSLGGDWTLHVTDTTYSDNAQFLGFSFNATTAAVPEASTAAGLSLACLALPLLAWKRRRAAATS